MKKILTLVAVVLLTVTSASAELKFGPRIGLAVNNLKFNSDIASTSNRAGFTAGVQLEYMLPITNLGIDASLMFVRRSNDIVATGTAIIDEGGVEQEEPIVITEKKGRNYIEIPVNVKYKIGIPAVGKFFAPYIFTGPSFAFNLNKKDATEAFTNKTFDVAWNFGLGIELITHLQVSASYGLGLSKSITKAGGIGGAEVYGKDRFWTITAAYLF